MNRLTLTTLLGLMAATGACAEQLENLTLEQATRLALENHRTLRVSQANIDMAEAQYRQAMAAFGPKLGLEAGFQRADEDRTFTFAGAIQTPPMTSLINGLGQALAPNIAAMSPAEQQQIAGALAQAGASQTIPMNIEVKMFDRDVTKAGLNFSYPLYTGGKKEAMTAMAKKGVQIAREERRKTELEVVRDVNKYYHGVQFAEQMAKLSSDTLERFQVLEDLTERLYQNTSLKVKKTDYLRSKTTTALIRSAAQEASYGSTLSKDALANAMGLPPSTQLSLAPEVAAPVFDGKLESLISDAMSFNPDKQRLELAIEAPGTKLPTPKALTCRWLVWKPRCTKCGTATKTACSMMPTTVAGRLGLA